GPVLGPPREDRALASRPGARADGAAASGPRRASRPGRSRRARRRRPAAVPHGLRSAHVAPVRRWWFVGRTRAVADLPVGCVGCASATGEAVPALRPAPAVRTTHEPEDRRGSPLPPITRLTCGRAGK